MQRVSLRRQQGVAAVLLLIMIPVLLALMVLTQESARYLQERTWLGNATETTALMISTSRVSTDEHTNRLAQNVLNAITTTGSPPAISVQVRSCRENPACDQSDVTPYMEYRVLTHNNHNRIFSASYPIDPGKWPLRHNATVRKNEEHRTIDVAFVADYSFSMRLDWWNTREVVKKRVALHETVGIVADEIEALSADVTDRRKNTLSYIPFEKYTKEKKTGQAHHCYKRQVVDADADKAVRELFTDKPCTKIEWPYYDSGIYTVHPVTEARIIKESLREQDGDGGTATYEGVIRAAQILRATKNQRRIMVILTDCDDLKDSVSVHARLNELGYCDRIRNEITSQKTPEGKDVTLEIAVIGFNCSPDSHISHCADKDRIFSAETPDQLHWLMRQTIGGDFSRLHQDEP